MLNELFFYGLGVADVERGVVEHRHIVIIGVAWYILAGRINTFGQLTAWA